MTDRETRRVARTRRRRVWLVCGAAVFFVPVVIVALAYRTVPLRNNDDPQVDALLVLGAPTKPDGSVSEPERWRVDEAVREYRAGRAEHILITGGPTTKSFVEARAMARYARSQGVPWSALLEEPTAMTTVENVRNSARILDAHGWRRVEVISSPEHLARAALLLRTTDLQWQMHAAPTPGRSRIGAAAAYAEEAFGTAVIRAFGPKAEPLLHGFARVQHAVWLAGQWCADKVRRRPNG